MWIESEPTATFHLCNDHFTKNCIIETSLMAAKFEIKTQRMLRPDAVPTIFERKVAPSSKKRAASCSTELGYSQATNTTRPAFEKQEKTRV